METILEAYAAITNYLFYGVTVLLGGILFTFGKRRSRTTNDWQALSVKDRYLTGVMATLVAVSIWSYPTARALFATVPEFASILQLLDGLIILSWLVGGLLAVAGLVMIAGGPRVVADNKLRLGSRGE